MHVLDKRYSYIPVRTFPEHISWLTLQEDVAALAVDVEKGEEAAEAHDVVGVKTRRRSGESSGACLVCSGLQLPPAGFRSQNSVDL